MVVHCILTFSNRYMMVHCILTFSNRYMVVHCILTFSNRYMVVHCILTFSDITKYQGLLHPIILFVHIFKKFQRKRQILKESLQRKEH
jgi:hypothetical protein